MVYSQPQTSQPQSAAKTPNKPVFKHSAGAISATGFSQEIQTKDGPKQVTNVVLQRAYTDKEGKWQHTNSFKKNDLPKVVLVAQQAYESLVTKQDEDAD